MKPTTDTPPTTACPDARGENPIQDRPAVVPTEMVKETLRQAELRLTAQLQTRLSLEGRASSSMPWLLALTVAAAGVVASVTKTDYRHPVFVVALTVIAAAAIANLFVMPMPVKWRYPGSSPSDLINYISVSVRKPSWLRRKFAAITAHMQSGGIRARMPDDLFDRNDTSMDHVLHRIAVRYAEDIALNDDWLREIKRAGNFPIYILYSWIDFSFVAAA